MKAMQLHLRLRVVIFKQAWEHPFLTVYVDYLFIGLEDGIAV